MDDQPIKVLIVEDDDEDFVLAKKHLSACETQDFQVSRAALLADGLAMLRDSRFDVVLLDVGLPDSQGWDTLQAALPFTDGIPIVVLTGQANETLGMEALRHGAQDYLFKGEIGTQHLVRAIRYAIERAKSEESLRQYRDRLEELVEERTTRLRDALTKLEVHDRAKTRFVAGITHDLKTPITSIGYGIDNLLTGAAGEFPAKAESYLQMLKADCQRIALTANDILDMSRIEEHKLALHRVKLPFHRFCAEALEGIREIAGRKDIRLDVSVSESVGIVNCDPMRLERSIINIVENAIKYTPEEGVIEVILDTDAGMPDGVRLRVVDNGIGISPEHLPHVTDLYHRANEHTAGSGLGLTLAREVVLLHEGRIEILSPPPDREDGTVVTIELPVDEPSSVLVVDDDEAVCALVAQQLEAEGYAVASSTNAADAMEQTRGSRPDAILLDMILPGEEHLVLLTSLKCEPELRDIPIVAMTGGEIGRAEREILESFAIPVVQKPWTLGEIEILIYHAILGKHYASASRRARPV